MYTYKLMAYEIPNLLTNVINGLFFLFDYVLESIIQRKKKKNMRRIHIIIIFH